MRSSARVRRAHPFVPHFFLALFVPILPTTIRKTLENVGPLPFSVRIPVYLPFFVLAFGNSPLFDPLYEVSCLENLRSNSRTTWQH